MGASEPAFLRRIRLRARRRVRWLRHLWAAEEGSGLGIAISHGEVDRILAGADDRDGGELSFYEHDDEAHALASAISEADLALAMDPHVLHLRGALELEDAELDLLTLAAAIEVDPWMRRAFGYLHDDPTSGHATPWLARRLFRWDPGVRIGPDSALVRWRIARPADSAAQPWSASAPWIIDPYVASCLVDGVSIDPRLAKTTELVRPTADGLDTCLYPHELAAAQQFVEAMLRETDRPIELVLAAATGSGRRTLAATLCGHLGIPLLVADAGALMGPEIDAAEARESAIRVARTARLFRAAVYWHHADRAVPAIWREIEGRVRLSIHGCETGSSTHPSGVAVRRIVPLPPLGRAARQMLWSWLSEREPPLPVLEWPLLPADIVRAAAMAPAGPEAVIDACRATLQIDAASLAQPLPRPYEWDDLVVGPSVKAHLRELEAQARLRFPVYEEWGFRRMVPMGGGTAALFAGPSGTGKTMAAQVLARELGMAIYRVDLAGVMSKYIGETEKNLKRVFDACERANVLLFFDEADALFGQRMQVKDAHDRFANIEIDYLLQRMEQFEGVAVLATNRRGDIDSAFLRRVRFIIDFLPPNLSERRELWSRALPECAPDGRQLLASIDWGTLAERLDMTGADIKATALAAAFLARSEGQQIGMQHVLHAARRQLAKRGVIVRTGDFE